MKRPRDFHPDDRNAPTVGGAPDSNEFFYINKDGCKDDTNLHGPILRAVDWPIDEKIMAPIREKHRKAARNK